MNTRKLSPAMIRTLQKLEAGQTYGHTSISALKGRGFVEAEYYTKPPYLGHFVRYKITDAGRAALREITS